MRKQSGIELEEVNYAKTALDEATVKSIVAKAGVKNVLNARHAIAKEKGWTVDDPPDADTFAKAAAKDVNLLRRPIVIAGKKAIVGFNKTEYAKLGE